MEHGIERRHHRQQRLRGADVRGRLFAADMLLARLQGQPVGLPSGRVDADAHDPARHRPLQIVAAGHEARMRPAIAHRHAEPLRGADADIGPHRARLFQQAQRQQVGRDDRDAARGVQRLAFGAEVADIAEGAGILEDRAEHLGRIAGARRALDDLDPQRRGARLDHGDGLRVQVVADEERLCLGLRGPLRHRHRLGGRGRLVQQARVRNRQPGQVRDHGLEVQKRLEPPLRDFGLVGRVGGVPGRVFQDVALDRGRRDGAVIPLPDQAGHHRVLARHVAHEAEQLMFGQRRPVERPVLPDRAGDRLPDQLVEAVAAHGLEHLGHLGRRRADMAAVGEVVGVVVGGGPAGHGITRALGPSGPDASTAGRPDRGPRHLLS